MRIPEGVYDITPEWLGAALSESGAMMEGRVTGVISQPRAAFGALEATLHIGYAAGADRLPERMVLRLSSAKPSMQQAENGRNEVQFAQRVAAAMIDKVSPLPILRPFGAGHDRRTGRSFLLFDDASESHVTTVGPFPPTLAAFEQAVDTLARFHAFWWQHPYLANVGEPPSPRLEAIYVTDLEETLPVFLEIAGAALSGHQRHMLEQAIHGVEALIPHTAACLRNTVRHGAPYPRRFLFPKDEGGSALLTQWRYWSVNRGINDVSSLVASQLSPDSRRRMERYLVRRYWQRLAQHGVEDYPWRECWRDYRISVVGSVFMPMWEWSMREPMTVWWPMVESLCTAFDDLECWEFVP